MGDKESPDWSSRVENRANHMTAFWPQRPKASPSWIRPARVQSYYIIIILGAQDKSFEREILFTLRAGWFNLNLALQLEKEQIPILILTLDLDLNLNLNLNLDSTTRSLSWSRILFLSGFLQGGRWRDIETMKIGHF